MKNRRETPYTASAELHADEFRRGRSYKNWRAHGTPDWLLIFTRHGSGCIRGDDGEMLTHPGDVILYSPGERQDYGTNFGVGNWQLLWVHFQPKPTWLPWLRWPAGPHGGRSIHLEKGEVRRSFIRAMERLIGVSRRRLPQAKDFAENALEEALLWAQTVAVRKGSPADARIETAMDYLVGDLRRPFNLMKLAQHCGLSVSRLAHLFKEEVGTSPQQFFERQRMWQAGRLLQLTGLRIAEVAAEVGYDDAFYFTHRFRRFSGKSPTQFRQQANPGRGSG